MQDNGYRQDRLRCKSFGKLGRNPLNRPLKAVTPVQIWSGLRSRIPCLFRGFCVFGGRRDRRLGSARTAAGIDSPSSRVGFGARLGRPALFRAEGLGGDQVVPRGRHGIRLTVGVPRRRSTLGTGSCSDRCGRFQLLPGAKKGRMWKPGVAAHWMPDTASRQSIRLCTCAPSA